MVKSGNGDVSLQTPAERLEGEVVRRYGLRGQKQAAADLGISTQYLNDLLRGRRGISVEVALKLEDAWANLDAEAWLLAQLRSDLALARKRRKKEKGIK